MPRYSLSSFLERRISSAWKRKEWCCWQAASVRVKVCCGKSSTYLPDRAQDIGLAVVVAVGTDTKVHLAWIIIPLEGLGDTKDRVWGACNADTVTVRERVGQRMSFGSRRIPWGTLDQVEGEESERMARTARGATLEGRAIRNEAMRESIFLCFFFFRLGGSVRDKAQRFK